MKGLIMGDVSRDGLVLRGVLRTVKTRMVRPADKEAFEQTIAVVDAGEDFLHTVVCPKDEVAAFEAALGGLIGVPVAIRVNAGDYRRLWYVGLA